MARPNLYKIVGIKDKTTNTTDYVQVKLKPKEIKATIMRANRWNEEQYRKQYDIFKNKLRAYESFKREHGVEIETQSPLELLYKQAKAKIREGAAYEPSIKMRTIQSFSAVSITKGRQLAKQTESAYSRARGATIEAVTQAAFGKFIEKNEMASEIDMAIDDPVKKEAALAALAEHVKAKKSRDGQAIPEGESYGSEGGAGNDFDYSEWLD